MDTKFIIEGISIQNLYRNTNMFRNINKIGKKT